jgi:FlaA1/EpsC-like NDP-sugar epimerase
MRLDGNQQAEQLTLWHDSMGRVGSNSVAQIDQYDGGKESRSVRVGHPFYRAILFVGDILLIATAGCLGPLLRLGVQDAIADFTGFAWMLGITTFLLPLLLYVFDLYSPERNFKKWEIASRSAIAVFFGGIVGIFVLYLHPVGSYGRGVMALQWVLLWSFLNGWRWVHGSMFRRTFQKIPVIIVGAGSCGKVLQELLKSPLSPYEVKGFLDDDPTKFGTAL